MRWSASQRTRRCCCRSRRCGARDDSAGSSGWRVRPMSDITWQFHAAIPGGPTFYINQPSIAVQAYDVATAAIAPNASNVDVNVQPSSTAGDVVFVVINSDQYGAGLTYTVDGGSNAHALDAPHVMLGSGAVGFMNAGAPPQVLTFASTLAIEANVQVVIGRKNP